ncbi:MAG: ACT domain-containing protein [Verrucomicrobiota bacterium]
MTAGVATLQIAKQLALFLENRPGALARVCDVLGAAKINIHAISTSDTVDHIVIRMVVSEPTRALRIFEEHGSLVVATDVLLIHGFNKPGSLASIAHALADANINIEYAYCATNPDARQGIMVLRASNPRKALKILNLGWK